MAYTLRLHNSQDVVAPETDEQGTEMVPPGAVAGEGGEADANPAAPGDDGDGGGREAGGPGAAGPGGGEVNE